MSSRPSPSRATRTSSSSRRWGGWRRPRGLAGRTRGSDRHGDAGGCRRSPPLRPLSRARPTLGCGARSRRAGIEQLYTHQAEAFEHVLAGRNVVTITPTASGKTLCYNAPVLDAILKDPSTRALYLFPTKALAQDQLAELHALAELVERRGARADGPEIGVFTYDGDTPSDARRAIRGKAHVVLSNPDMLHSGILPHHPRWAKLFENLKFVVIDELHAYRGVFGSHLSNIMRRLQRVCRHYGSDPIFICSSATIANPRELAEGLTGRSFELIDRSGAPRGEKFFLFVNPPVVNAQLGIRRSYLSESRRVALEFLKHNLQLILFAQSRLATEILTTYLKDAYQGPPGASDVIRGYRGGYLPNRRREIERGLRDGEVRAVVSTNALELGHRHRRARRRGHGRLSGHDCGDLAARRPRGPAVDAVGGRARRQQRADRSVHHPQPVVLLRRVARARADQPRQPAHPARPREVRRVRAAVLRCDETFGQENVQEMLVGARRGGLRPRGGRAVELDARVLSGRRRQPAVGVVRQLRHRRHHARRARHWRDRFHAAVPRCSTRRRSTSSKGSCSRSSASTSTAARRMSAPWTATTTPTRSPIRRSRSWTPSRVAGLPARRMKRERSAPRSLRRSRPAYDHHGDTLARRSPRRLPGRRVQEDQVLHQREHRLGRARSARAADAHVVVLADDSVRRHGRAARIAATTGATA